jgi:hypothetical protein
MSNISVETSGISAKMNDISVVKPNISEIEIISVEKQQISEEMSNISAIKEIFQ